MDLQNVGWIIVEFCDDKSVEIVPDFWLDNNLCAWPKASTQAKRFVQKRIVPNTNDFIFYKSRKIGLKTYGSYNEAKFKLPKAMHKSDLSSADDTYDGKRKRKIKELSSSPEVKVVPKIKKLKESTKSSNIGPPRYDYSQFKHDEVKELTDDSYSSNYDSDKDPLWKIKNNEDNCGIIKGNECFTPDKRPSDFAKSLRKEVIASPNGIWTVQDEVQDKGAGIKLPYSAGSDNERMKIKKVLFNNCKENSGTTSSSQLTETLKSSKEIAQNNPVQENFDISENFQRFITNTLVNIKYDVGSILNIVQANSVNINALMANSSSSAIANPGINLNKIFPIKNIDELQTLEEKIKADENLKNILVTQLSVLVDISDLGNSVRRIVARMFSDTVLANYSLFGFKSKLCFSSLQSYRVIIDSIRVNVKYSLIPEKDIDNALGIWLSHAPFRLKKKSRKQDNNITS